MDAERIADSFITEPVETIYHYASLQGAEGIIGNGLWATGHQHLNDTSEISYGLSIFKEVICSNDWSRECDFKFEYDYKKDVVEMICDHSIRKSIFCCSFSEEDNLLSQWRGYCPKIGGVSLGFDRYKLRDKASKNGFKLGS